MRLPEVERVIRLRARSEATRLGARRQHIGIVVRPDAVGALRGGPLVITHRRPADRMAQRRLVRLEEPRLEFHILPAVIRHVADMNVEIQRALVLLYEIDHRAVDRVLRLASRAAIAHHPEARPARRARHGQRDEVIARVRLRQPPFAVRHRVVVERVRREIRQAHFVLVAAYRRAVEARQPQQLRLALSKLQQLRLVRRQPDARDRVVRGRNLIQVRHLATVAHQRHHRSVGAPHHRHRMWRRQLHVGRAGEMICVRRRVRGVVLPGGNDRQ